MDDYYDLLDVAPDAGRDDIRSAYRSKRDALTAAEGDQNKGKVAELNRAWNVLSDPAQRERYDERLAEYRESEADGEEHDDDDGDARPARATRPARAPAKRSSAPQTRAEQRAEQRRARMDRTPTIVLPDGLTMASTKARLSAMGFDLLILILVFVVCYFAGVKIINDRYPRQTDRITAIADNVKAIDKRISADSKQADAADAQAAAAATKKDDAAEATAKRAATEARAAKAAEQKKRNQLSAESKKLSGELKPASLLVFAGTAALMLLYLVPMTATTGQTLGKRLQHVRVVKLDGSLPGWSTALKRYGTPLLGATALSIILGPLALAVVMIVLVGWVTKPNRQGMHDRLANTVVVEA
jgi:curved DNA-binding protein CbpA